MSNWNQDYYANQNYPGNTYHNRFYNNTPEQPSYNNSYSAGNYVPPAQAMSAPGGSQIDVLRSNLHPTAAEFKPRQYHNPDGVQSVQNTQNVQSTSGTVKKPQKYRNNKKNYYNNGYRRGGDDDYENGGSENKGEAQSVDGRDVKEENFSGRDRNDKYYKGYQNRSNNWYDNKGGSDNNRSDYKKKWGGRNNYNNSKFNKRNDNSSEVNWREKKDFNKDPKEKRGQKYQNVQSNQRERLQDQLERNQLECMVCCERLRNTDPVWSCKQCYNVLHLKCIKQWANTSKLESGWRCPACQNIYPTIPEEYYCYCEKILNPKYEPGMTPHSCGEICQRKGRFCEHACTLLCHPGPCPECTVSVAKPCGCGRTKATVACNADTPVTCQSKCEKLLNCGLHKCEKNCHAGDCSPCTKYVKQECYCGKVGRTVICTEEVKNVDKYECDDVCGKMLACGNHKCMLICHSGSCPPCETSPDVVTTCYCGQTKLAVVRESCFDPIPSCEKICNKILKCGQPSQPHRCQEKCHKGECPDCSLTTMVRCRCGYMDKEIACSELTTKADDARCQKKCTKMRLCCKHKCNQFCCIEIEHRCSLICNRALSCGIHRCEQECHRGRCLPCPRMSFEELFCECGACVTYPPIACGTRPPDCNQPCSRRRECGHDPGHKCHIGPCPPCTVLCKRWCHGKHEQRSTILCYQDEFSCGLPCGKDLPCGQHKCIQPCHTNSCPLPCTQPCTKPRVGCDHPCAAPCHKDAPCPDTPCKQIVKVTCECGLRSSTRVCMDLAGEYQSITMKQLASKMADIQKGQTVDLSDIVGGQKKNVTPKTLECTEECRVVERNRRLAIGLQIRNPDLSAKLTPRYSDFMRTWAKKDPRFCQHIHDKLSELVQLAKQSKQKSRSHSFETMNRDKRAFVHEYCEHFGCESAAYDAEPNRNVVATAFRDKSWLPSVSILELLQRENGQRKVPGPILRSTVAPKKELVSLRVNNTRSGGSVNLQSGSAGEIVDCYDEY
ncbi:protein shuttle craft [Onthophagus taurus]|uniref:protein shuttle craft n=1 Tax=Onthophagus taurus TaxID=166361 RepID=UPI0039BDF3FC